MGKDRQDRGLYLDFRAIETKPCHSKGLLFLLVLPEKNHGDCPAVSMLIAHVQPANSVDRLD